MEERLNKKKLYIRNVIFGVEDSLVSTVGLLSGIAVAGVSVSNIILTGTVLIFVEALSMAAGSFLSEQSVQEYALGENGKKMFALVGGVIMFFSYFLSGFISLLPYIILQSTDALPYSIGAALISLFVLGTFSAHFFKARILINGFRMLLVGGFAILVGVFAGGLVG